MPVCPNCAGEMKFDRKVRMYVCKGCGLMLSRWDLMNLKDRRYDEEEKKDVVEEYIEWWEGRRKR